jgi:probable rRNA maturation factor
MILVEASSDGEWDSSTDWQRLAEAAVQGAVRASDHAQLCDIRQPIEVSVRFSSDEEVRALNASWRGKDRATNVLSFPMLSSDELDRLPALKSGEVMLGDIILADGVCAREAGERGVAIAAHATHLVVHGTLHLLGYDHETGDAEAEQMENVERNALAPLGISDPYLIEG